MKYKRRITTILKGVLFLLLAYLPQLTHAQTGSHITLKQILDGAKGQLTANAEADSLVVNSESWIEQKYAVEKFRNAFGDFMNHYSHSLNN